MLYKIKLRYYTTKNIKHNIIILARSILAEYKTKSKPERGRMIEVIKSEE